MTPYHIVRAKPGLFRLAASLAVLVCARPVFAQAPIQILEPVESLDRQVVLRWSMAPGDTFTAEARREVPELGFITAKSQGFLPNKFRNGALIVGRGPSVPTSTAGILEIGSAGDLMLASELPWPVEPSPAFDVAGVFQFGRNLIGVAFTQAVNPTTALTPGSYTITPSLAVTATRLQDNGQTVILETGAALSPGTAYSLAVAGVTSAVGAAPASPGPFPFSAPNVAGGANIADLYASPGTYNGQTVTVFGQVTLPTGARGSTIDGFVQDGSGRGIRLRGGSVLAAVNDYGNVAAVTGTLAASPRLSIGSYGAVLLASGQPRLGARVVEFSGALSPALEGTFIQTQGFLSRVDADSDPEMVQYFTVDRDTLFTGYQVWRAPAENPTAFALLRTYSLLDSTWTFTGTTRIFVDPDSIIVRGTERDPEREDDELVPGPFNGFGYTYAVTWFNGVVDATVFPFRITLFDTLRGEEGALSPTVYPSPSARVSTPLLAKVRVVPNPYNPAAAFDRQEFPGFARVQFVNLPTEALVKIYTVAGDLVQELVKTPDPGDDSVVWDLKNADGEDVASGVYVYYVESGTERTRGHFVIAR